MNAFTVMAIVLQKQLAERGLGTLSVDACKDILHVVIDEAERLMRQQVHSPEPVEERLH